ncbi:hypothetical protein [Pinisolibacter sp.]|uniref:hypothetical protein n=1 Tax=Pinisolibacter sp. TaxID=2172024 RepID=UPI002FDE8301
MPKPSSIGSIVGPAALVLGLTAALALPLTAPATAQQPAETSARLTCTGPFSAEASHASLVAIVGKDNAIFELVDGAEGEKVASTVLFPKNEKRRLELMWADENKRRGLVHVRLSDTSTWVAPNGLKIGMTLAEVEKLNGEPFTLSGFDWDYGGYVTDWKGGTLGADIPGGCTVQARFTVPEGAPEGPASKVSGDREFASTDKNMRAVKPVIGSLSFGFPQP